jgi:hypothetical protein
MSKDPERCCIERKDGTRCPNKPLYKIGRKGFCEEHKPSPQRTRELSGTSTIATEQTRNFCGF